MRLLAREAGGSMRDAERMLETAIATSSGKVTEAEVASSLGVASRTTVLKLADAILQKNAAAALAHVRELASRGANLESLGRDLLETLRNLAVAKLPAGDSESPLDDIPDHEVAELKRLAAGASARDIMRLFRLMADSQEQILKSPYPDLLLEMAVVRMASLARGDRRRRIAARDRIDAASVGHSARIVGRWLWRPRCATGAGAESAIERCAAAAGRGRSQGGRAAAQRESAHATTVRANFPSCAILSAARRAALAGFMEQGAGLALDGDILTVTARNDIYIRYLNDNKNGDRRACERASWPPDSRRAVDQRRGEACGEPHHDAARSNGVTRELPPAAAGDESSQSRAENARNGDGAVETDRIDQGNRARVAGDRGARAARRPRRNGRRCWRIPRCDECSIRSTRGWWN